MTGSGTRLHRAWLAAFVAYAAATAVHIGLVVAHEPFAFDAWNIALDTRAEPYSLGRWLDYGIFEYAHSNPRIGQWLAYLAYKLAAFSPIATPIAYLALALAVTTLGLGRWPCARHAGRTATRDLGFLAIAIGFAWFALPRIGMIMFCRAYCANYLYGAVIQLWFLVPLRLGATRADRRALAAYFAFGVVAGMCNEHTGPTLVAFLVGYVLWQRRRAGRIPRLAAAGTLGAIAGFAAIFFAPGQESRYEGLATKVSLVGRLFQRGITSNLDILRDWVVACAPVLGLAMIALVLARRDDRVVPAGHASSSAHGAAAGANASLDGAAVGVNPSPDGTAGSSASHHGAAAGSNPSPDGAAGSNASPHRTAGSKASLADGAAGSNASLDGAAASNAPSLAAALGWMGLALAAGTLITATVFVSPKLGPRFYLHGCALVLAGFLAIADRTLITRRRLAPFVVLAVAASIYAGVRSLPLYLRLADQSADRLAALARAPRGSVFTAESFEQVDDTWWFLGDDFRDVKKRDLIATYFDLRGVIFRAVDIEAPLGVSDVKLVPRYQVTPASCLDERGGLDLGSFRGIDIASVHKAAEAAIERLRERIAPTGRLDRLDLVVGFAGDAPPLPRPNLVVGRWLPSGYEGHTGVIERRGSSKVRRVVLPKELAGTDYEIYAYQVSGEARRLGTARDAELAYVPWKRGSYWALACRPAECFVFAAARAL